MLKSGAIREIRNLHQQIIHRIDARDHARIGNLARGDFDDTLIDVIRQCRSRAGFFKCQIKQLMHRDFSQIEIDLRVFPHADGFERFPIDVNVRFGFVVDVIDHRVQRHVVELGDFNGEIQRVMRARHRRLSWAASAHAITIEATITIGCVVQRMMPPENVRPDQVCEIGWPVYGSNL